MTIVSDFVASNPSMAGVSDKHRLIPGIEHSYSSGVLPHEYLLHLLNEFDTQNEVKTSSRSASASDDDMWDLLVQLETSPLEQKQDSPDTRPDADALAEIIKSPDYRELVEAKQGSRRVLDFPRPWLHYRDNYYSRVRAHLISYGLRFINDARELGYLSELPSEAELAAFLENRVNITGSEYIYGPGEHRYGLSRDSADVAIASAAESVLRLFNPTWHARQVNRGRKGGKASKRPKVYTAEHLASVAHLSKRDAALALGCSESTIARLRRGAAACVR